MVEAFAARHQITVGEWDAECIEVPLDGTVSHDVYGYHVPRNCVKQNFPGKNWALQPFALRGGGTIHHHRLGDDGIAEAPAFGPAPGKSAVPRYL